MVPTRSRHRVVTCEVEIGRVSGSDRYANTSTSFSSMVAKTPVIRSWPPCSPATALTASTSRPRTASASDNGLP